MRPLINRFLGVFAIIMAPLAFSGELLNNGGFELPAAFDNFTTNQLPGWKISADVDVIKSWWQPAEGLQSIDLAGEVAGPGAYIEQQFATQPGRYYTLSFWFSNNPDDSWARGQVTLIGTAQLLSRDLYHESAAPADMKYTSVQGPFLADSTNTILRFTHLDSPHPVSRGIVLDGVSVVEAGNLIRNGSFELPLPGGNTTADLPWWTVHNTIDVVGSYWQAVDGTHSVDLSGDNAGPGTSIQQTILTVPGRQYILSFWYANNADTSFAVAEVRLTGDQILFNEEVTHTGSTHASMNYTLFERSFIADTNRATLKFTHLNSPDPLGRGVVIDDVAITPAPVLNLALSGQDQILMTWNAEPGRFYQVESTASLSTPNWQPITDWLPGAGMSISINQTRPLTSDTRFYRLNARL